MLCSNLVNRKLFRIELKKEKAELSSKKELIEKCVKQYKLTEKEASFFVVSGEIENSAYRTDNLKINILMNNGKIIDIAEAGDQLNVEVLSKTVKKYFICYPKDLILKK